MKKDKERTDKFGNLKVYEKQSISLRYVQRFGSDLEQGIKDALGWDSGRVIYYKNQELKYDLQVDSCYPSTDAPEVFVSVTYCNPDKPGHSNENKLQLKLGELMLLKGFYPNIKSVLVIGGNEGTWLPYVLEAFNYFFDKTIYAWEDNFEQSIDELRENPNNIQLKHSDTWAELSKEWNNTNLWEDEPIDSFLRINTWEKIVNLGKEGELPEDISNEIFRHCMQAAYTRSVETRNRNGKEWTNYQNENWGKLWESRSFFNPGEAAIELSLSKTGFAFSGGLAKDVDVPSLIHHLGGDNVDKTKVSEDFVLFSKKLNLPVLIQSKATGGGKARHGKNIQNRTKEQVARSLFYRGGIADDKIILRPKDYYWIGVLDGNWGVTRKTPLKYLHMLQWAGYDYLIAADALIDENIDLVLDNPLIEKLRELECITDQDEFEKLWNSWKDARMKQ